MRAAVFHGAGDVRVEDVPAPAPGPGELLLEVATVGICGTDAHEFRNGPHVVPLDAEHPVTGHRGPLVLGHEIAGHVLARGDGVDAGAFPDGALVVSGGGIACGDCRWCRAERPQLCDAYATVGLQRHGGLTEQVVVPAWSALDVSDRGLTADAAALAQPMAIAVHATRRARVAADEVVVLVGAGGIGAFLVAAMTDAGARVVASDLAPERLAIATRLGAVATHRAGDGLDLAEVVAEVGPPDLVVEVTGSPVGLGIATGLLGRGSRLLLVGIQEGAAPLDLRHLTLLEREVIGTNALVATTDLPEAVRLLAAREDGWQDVAPEAIGLDDLVAAGLAPLTTGRSTRIKTLIDPRTPARRPTRMRTN